MSDVDCPYCGAAQEINHDDGYGYEEDETHEQKCGDCGKTFHYTTQLSLDYTVTCQPEDHIFEWLGQRLPLMWGCKRCNYCERRELPQEAE